MNSILLLVIAVLAAGFGYRFYSKLLALAVYALDDNYSTPARDRPDDQERVPTNPHFLFGHHVAAVSGLTLVGAAVALQWGWAPAFLWVVAGTTVGAGAFAMASLWLSVRRPVAGLYAVAAEFLGPVGAYAFAAAGLLLLLALNVFSAGVAALLLTAYPGAAGPFAILLLLGAALGRYLHGRRESSLPPASLVALLLLLGAIFLLGTRPLTIAGALQLELGGSALATIDAIAVWTTLLLVYGFFAARAPVWTMSRPRSYLTTLLALVALVIWYAGLALMHPTVTAPELHAAPDAPGVFPWLFVTLAGGTLAGFHFMIAHGVTAKQMKREGQARYLGYGGALADGLLALTVIIVAATAFADADAWREAHATWSGVPDVPRALALIVDGVANYGAAIGMAPTHGRTLAALVFIGLGVATLEAGMRILKHLLLDVAQAAQPADGRSTAARRLLPALTARGGLHLAFWLSLAVALIGGRALSEWWLLFGMANLLYAGLALSVTAAAVRAAARSALVLWALASFALVLAGWALAATVVDGVLAGRWLHSLIALALLSTGGIVLWQMGRRFQRTALPAAPPGA